MSEELVNIESTTPIDWEQKYLKPSGKALHEMMQSRIEQSHGYGTVIIPTVGGRVLSSFVRGIRDDVYEENEALQKPMIFYLQVSKGADPTIQSREQERISEIVAHATPPYLIIDDYATSEITTLSYIENSLKERGLEGNDIDKFAFVVATTLKDGTPVDTNIYSENNIKYGALDARGYSKPFPFVDSLALTEKDYLNKYESKPFGLSPFEERSARKLRQRLYKLGRTFN